MENMEHLSYGIIFILGTLVIYKVCFDMLCLNHIDKDKASLKCKVFIYLVLVGLTLQQGRFVLGFTGFAKAPIYDDGYFGILLFMILGWVSSLVTVSTTMSLYSIVYPCLSTHVGRRFDKTVKVFAWYVSYCLFIICIWSVLHIGIYVEVLVGKLISTIG